MNNPYKDILNTREIKNTSVQEVLKQAFLSLYNRKKLQDINVKELCSVASCARTTFYAYYQNTSELLESIEDDYIRMLLDLGIGKGIIQITDINEQNLNFFDGMLNFLDEHKVNLYILLVENPDIRFIEKWKKGIKYYLWEKFCKNKKIKNEKLVLEMVSSEIISAYTFYLKYPYEVDFTEVKKNICNTLKAMEY